MYRGPYWHRHAKSSEGALSEVLDVPIAALAGSEVSAIRGY